MDDYISDIEELLRDGKLDDAEEKAREVLLANPDDSRATLALARALFFNNKQAESETLIGEILKADDQNLDALSLLAYMLEWQKRFPEAKEILLKVLPLSTKKAWVYFRLGKLVANTENSGGSREEALNYYKAAVTSENPPPEAFEALAFLETDSRAIYIFQHGISRYPDNETLWFDLCRHLYHIEDYLKCVETVEDAEAKGISIEDGAWIKTLAYYQLERYQDALNAIATLKEDDDTDEIVKDTIKGLLNYLSGDYQNAEKFLLKAIEEDISNSINYGAHILLTSVYLVSSKIKEAEKIFDEIPLTLKRVPQLDLGIDKRIYLYLPLREHYLEMLEKVESTATSLETITKAKFFHALNRYAQNWQSALSSDELKKIRDDLLMFESEIESMPISVYELMYENLYSIAADLGEWVSAIDYYREFIYFKKDPPAISRNILDGINKSQKQFEKVLALITKHSGSYKRESLVKIAGQLTDYVTE